MENTTKKIQVFTQIFLKRRSRDMDQMFVWREIVTPGRSDSARGFTGL